MARVVDRLLAQLPGLQGAAESAPPAFRSSAGEIRVSGGRYVEPPTLIGLWARVTLGLILGAMVPTWPYLRDCGVPLFAYLGAVAAVILAGAWAGVTAWKLRAGWAHILSLMLVFWGIVLVAEQILPRIGYSVDWATWRCEDAGPANPRS